MVYNQYTGFEFDKEKSRSNKIKHGIDFYEAQDLWESVYIETHLISEGEPRWAVVGIIGNLFWTAIITKRLSNIRIISVRRSRYEEKQSYQEYFQEED